MTRQLQQLRPLVVFDLEATGTDVNRDRIVQIAMVRIDPGGGRSESQWLVNPEMPIPPEASAVHGITDDQAAAAPTLSELADEILTAVAGADLCGFNAIRFDIPMLAFEMERVGRPLDLDGVRFVDPMIIFHRRERRDLAAAVRFYCDCDHEGAHDALADARATVDVLLGQLDRYADLPARVDDLHDLCVDPRAVDLQRKLRRNDDGEITLAFGKHRGEPLGDVPTDYFEYLLEADFPADVRSCFRTELDRRGSD